MKSALTVPYAKDIADVMSEAGVGHHHRLPVLACALLSSVSLSPLIKGSAEDILANANASMESLYKLL